MTFSILILSLGIYFVPALRMPETWYHAPSKANIPIAMKDDIDAIWNAFEKYDVDKSGSIDVKELQQLSSDLYVCECHV